MITSKKCENISVSSKRNTENEREIRMESKANIREIQRTFQHANDDYDIIVALGKMMQKYDISDNIKDSLKEVVREAIAFGYELGKNEKDEK